jgi:adenylate cyclase
MATVELDAERGSLFLNDPATDELYSVIAKGNFRRRIRIPNSEGIAGHVFNHEEAVCVDDAYNDPRFNREVDQQTGFTTRNILCVPIRTVKQEVIGVAQILNKREDGFSVQDQELLEAITTQASIILESTEYIERMQISRKKELEFLDIVADITSEIDLGTLLRKVMSEATKMLQAERSTLFLNDEKSDELWSLVGEGIGATEIRFPNHLGIAGTVFTTGRSVNIPHAYADLRFNPAFDKQTGFFTRSILCTPVVNKDGKVIGVTQVLNKHGGPFTDEDESRLRAFTAQVSISLENAKLFDDVQSMKNYNESMLQSMTNGVMTLDEERRIVTCNSAGLHILSADEASLLQQLADEFFTGDSAWLVERIRRVEERRETETVMDAELTCDERVISVNATVGR